VRSDKWQGEFCFTKALVKASRLDVLIQDGIIIIRFQRRMQTMGKSLFDPIVGQFPGHMNVCRDMAKPLAQKIGILNGTGGVE
jgi:hypothetical protein